jgi:hypothetical protein
LKHYFKLFERILRLFIIITFAAFFAANKEYGFLLGAVALAIGELTNEKTPPPTRP